MVIIIGAGLSGLLLGYRLKIAGIEFKILEARNRVGGRIHTLDSKNNTPVELGATWFGKQHQYFNSLLEELDLKYFEQYMTGKSFFQPFSTAPAEAIQIPNQAPSYRIGGGTTQVIDRLCEEIGEKLILLNQPVSKIELRTKSLVVRTNEDHTAKYVVMSLPPKVWANEVNFIPSLPSNLTDVAMQTNTWMEDSIKVAITFKEAFWRTQNKSGTLFSNVGPFTECYDHSNIENDRFSLCGFVSYGYKSLEKEVRKAKILKQLVEVFGAQSKDYIDYQEVIWSDQKYTSSPTINPLFPHQNNGNSIFHHPYFDGKLFFSGTEVSPHYGGYMEGAVFSANLALEKIMNSINQSDVK